MHKIDHLECNPKKGTELEVGAGVVSRSRVQIRLKLSWPISKPLSPRGASRTSVCFNYTRLAVLLFKNLKQMR